MFLLLLRYGCYYAFACPCHNLDIRSYWNVKSDAHGFVPIDPHVSCSQLQDLRVTLVWTEPAAAIGSTSALIHDLDLVVIAQSTGTEYYPNGGDGADTVNNVEKVIITDTTELETYTIRVRVSWGRGRVR